MSDLFTVEDLARILDLHPKTIRRYIREGQLKALKVGGEWRIRKEDTEMFMGGRLKEWKAEADEDMTAFVNGQIVELEGEYQVCSILDCYVGAEKAAAISQLLVQLMNEPEEGRGKAKFQYFYLEKEKKSRYILWGTPAFAGKMLTAVGEAVR